MLAPKHLNINSEISRCGVQVLVSEQFLDGAQVTAVGQQVFGEAGAQQVRVVTAPGCSPVLFSDPVIPAANTECATGVAIDYLPHSAAVGESLAVARHKQYQGFAWPCAAADSNPGLDEPHHFTRERHIAVCAAFTAANEQGLVGQDVTDLECDELAGADTGFIGQADHDVVAESYQRREIRRSEQLANFGLGQHTWQPRRCAPGGWHQQIQVHVDVFPALQPTVPAADGIQFLVERGRGHRGAAIACPGGDGGSVRC